MRTIKNTLAYLLVVIFACSCQSDFEDNKPVVSGTRNDITLETLKLSATTRSSYGLDENQEAYRCSSKTSSLTADIYLSDDKKEAVTLILNADLDPAYYLKFKTEGTDNNNSTIFTAFNEFDEPIMSGKYNYENCYFEITDVYGNDVVTRASAASWGCSLSLWACGTIWGTAVGMVSGGAGLLVGLAYTAAAVQICDGL